MPAEVQLEPAEQFVNGDKPEIKVDDNTRELLESPSSLFNLTLTKYPKKQTVFLGRLHLQREVLSTNR